MSETPFYDAREYLSEALLLLDDLELPITEREDELSDEDILYELKCLLSRAEEKLSEYGFDEEVTGWEKTGDGFETPIINKIIAHPGAVGLCQCLWAIIDEIVPGASGVKGRIEVLMASDDFQNGLSADLEYLESMPDDPDWA